MNRVLDSITSNIRFIPVMVVSLLLTACGTGEVTDLQASPTPVIQIQAVDGTSGGVSSAESDSEGTAGGLDESAPEHESEVTDESASQGGVASGGVASGGLTSGGLTSEGFTPENEENMKQSFYSSEITDEIFARMQGKSFKEDCTLPREDLRYLHVLHKNLQGETLEGELVVNVHIADTVLDIMKQLYEADYPIEKIRLVDEYDADDEKSMADNNSSSFNFRFVSHTTKISKHGYGLAIDINPLYNPYITTRNGERNVEPANGIPYVDRSGDYPYKIDENDLAYRIFREAGFEWGGAWKNSKDYQHFEIPGDVIAGWYPN